jgi:hypothetical protein
MQPGLRMRRRGENALTPVVDVEAILFQLKAAERLCAARL